MQPKKARRLPRSTSIVEAVCVGLAVRVPSRDGDRQGGGDRGGRGRGCDLHSSAPWLLSTALLGITFPHCAVTDGEHTERRQHKASTLTPAVVSLKMSQSYLCDKPEDVTSYLCAKPEDVTSYLCAKPEDVTVLSL